MLCVSCPLCHASVVCGDLWLGRQGGGGGGAAFPSSTAPSAPVPEKLYPPLPFSCPAEKFFEMKRTHAREAFDLYKKCPEKLESMKKFFELAEVRKGAEPRVWLI